MGFLGCSLVEELLFKTDEILLMGTAAQWSSREPSLIVEF
jgi:hypothetical protein